MNALMVMLATTVLLDGVVVPVKIDVDGGVDACSKALYTEAKKLQGSSLVIITDQGPFGTPNDFNVDVFFHNGDEWVREW